MFDDLQFVRIELTRDNWQTYYFDCGCDLVVHGEDYQWQSYCPDHGNVSIDCHGVRHKRRY